MMHADRPGLLEVRHISCGYGDRPVLDGVSLKEREGDVLRLAGLNGCGKSAFLKAVNGELPPACCRMKADHLSHRTQHGCRVETRGLHLLPTREPRPHPRPSEGSQGKPLCPRNPIIASFFRVIGYADQLGSGVRNLFKYSKAYGGSDLQLTDGDVFRTEVSLKALEVAPIGQEVAQKLAEKGLNDAINNAVAVFNALQSDGSLSIESLESMTRLSNGLVKNALRLLRGHGIIKREGADRGGRWVVLV